jgi:hypothetical protein
LTETSACGSGEEVENACIKKVHKQTDRGTDRQTYDENLKLAPENS